MGSGREYTRLQLLLMDGPLHYPDDRDGSLDFSKLHVGGLMEILNFLNIWVIDLI